MGYDTTFNGSLTFNKKPTAQFKEYINRFSSTRRMPRDVGKIKELYPNWREYCFFGELGKMGEYFAIEENASDKSIIDVNGYTCSVHPSLWCCWVVKGNKLVWNGAEKFGNYVEWLKYMITHFFNPFGYVLNGDIEFQGEDSSDHGVIHVVNNVVQMTTNNPIDNVSSDAMIKELKKRGYKVTV